MALRLLEVAFGVVDMGEQAERLKQRVRRFALAVIGLIQRLPSHEPGPTVRQQLAKSATSVDMNYRASCRARSHAEFAEAKLTDTDDLHQLREEACQSFQSCQSPD